MTPAEYAMPQGIEEETPWERAGYSHTPPALPEPPQPERMMEGFMPWQPGEETEMEYGFRCGVITGFICGLAIGGIAGAVAVAAIVL
jgi:hypothetical protein